MSDQSEFSEEILEEISLVLEKLSQGERELKDFDIEEVQKRLEGLKSTVKELEDVSRDWLSDQALDLDVDEQPEDQPDYIDDDTWALMGGIRSLRKDARGMRAQVAQRLVAMLKKLCDEKGYRLLMVQEGEPVSSDSGSKSKGPGGEKPSEKEKESRRIRFRRIGGRKDWRPI